MNELLSNAWIISIVAGLIVAALVAALQAARYRRRHRLDVEATTVVHGNATIGDVRSQTDSSTDRVHRAKVAGGSTMTIDGDLTVGDKQA